MPDLAHLRDLYKILLELKDELMSLIYQVPFSFENTGDANDQVAQLTENIQNGILEYAKVTVDKGFVRYTFYNKTNVKISGQEYEVGEITLYNDNYDQASFERDMASLKNSRYKNEFSFKTKNFTTDPLNMKITLNPVGNTSAKPITQDLKVNFNWNKAGKVSLVKPKDMTDSDWAFLPVVHNMTIGNFNGNENGDFMPKMAITRGQFATVLGRIGRADTKLYTVPNYSDVPSDKYYAPYTNWAKENNLFHLEDLDKFLPERDLTREEMAYILYQYIKMKGIELEDVQFAGFEDEAEISDWAKEAVIYLAKKGVIKGSNGKFDPKATFTREQVAQILYNLRGFM